MINIIAIFMIFLIVSNNFVIVTQAESCQIGGRVACIASCNIQNCASGYCNPNAVCVCVRCSNGTAW